LIPKFLSLVGLYWNTVRYLKPVQIYGRLWFRLARPRPDTSPAPALRQPLGDWVPCATRRQSLFADNNFLFLNQSGSLEKLGWDDLGTEKLWRYNQHYFDDLNAENSKERSSWHRALLIHWVEHNLPGQGTGWDPYPTSLRIVNWLKWTLAGHQLPDICVQSLAVQVRWLTKRLEIHLQGNHYFSNAKALVFAGLAFEGNEADKWLKKGLRIIERQLPEQVLSDGGNFERSPMYHSIFLEDMLDLINVAKLWPDRIDHHIVKDWEKVAISMVEWLRGMTHPDGQIALFNDAAFGVTPPPGNLVSYAQRIGLKITEQMSLKNRLIHVQNWPESGYVRLENVNATAFLDVAPIGPDYLPSHANADTLSFELSVFGQRVIVNGGTSRYGSGPERLRERQTAAHSTLEIDGTSSSEVWGGFRVARRAYPFDFSIHKSVGAVDVVCAHDGYTRLSGKPVHRRTWNLTEKSMKISDSIEGDFHSAVSRYIFHPDVKLEQPNNDSYRVILPKGEILEIQILQGESQIMHALHASEFGKLRDTQSLHVRLQNGNAVIQLSWEAY
jgi:uncharacterized heparinase superfamily protein